MSYTVSIFRKEAKQAEEQSRNKDFFENDMNILPFSAEQRNKLKERLLRYEYKIASQSPKRITFENGAKTALLTDRGLYFSASMGDGIFEISMTASEFTDDKDFAKYDPQAGGWETV
ncbi:MAG: hypothetical protein LBI57_04620 [Helicobacteraceae bacterium]|jgi:hypothetical protein|nr:hypothetical protein [Helicobacteraceae bacterium]